MQQGWRTFTATQVQALAQGPNLLAEPGERDCPACGEQAVRAYLSAVAGRRPTLVSYVWCRSCRCFVGSRTAHPPDLVLSDPLATLPADRRRELERSLTGFLAHLDELWDAGDLPQKAAARPA